MVRWTGERRRRARPTPHSIREMPAFIEPALAVLMQRPQASGARAYEIEFDGYRMQARLDAGDVPLFMHNGHDWTNQLPAAAPHPPAPA